jgi:membrane peptidoglycan carboxypeptidase
MLGNDLKPVVLRHVECVDHGAVHALRNPFGKGIRAIADGGYRPSNFDHNEAGEVSVADALRFSLNIPAVKVLGRYGPIRFSETLTRLRLKPARPMAFAMPGPLAITPITLLGYGLARHRASRLPGKPG